MRAILLFVGLAVAVLAFLVTQRSDDDSASNAASPQSTSPAATDGASGGTDPAAEPPDSNEPAGAEASSPVNPSQSDGAESNIPDSIDAQVPEDVRDVALRTSDLPPGFVPVDRVAPVDLSSLCPEAPEVAELPFVSDQMIFEQASSKALLISIVGDYGNKPAASNYLASVGKAVNACSLSGAAGGLRLTRNTGDESGDSSVAASLRGETDGNNVAGEFRYLRVGSRIAVIITLSTGTGDARVADEAARAIAARFKAD
ncbi:MAG: hypothetical protein WB767_08490 [Nocardioides sp.]